VTHDQAEAMTMSDRIAVMLDGSLLQIASPTELYEQPADLAVAEFIGSPKINVLPARLRDDGLVDAHGHTLALSARGCSGPRIKIAFRPENARLLPRRNGAMPEGGIAGQVVHRENLGSDVFIHLRSNEQTLVVRVHPNEAAAIAHGEEVRILPEPERVSLFDAGGRRIDVTIGAFADDRARIAEH
jgi:multiple sugar transport system ATP-binding protein